MVAVVVANLLDCAWDGVLGLSLCRKGEKRQTLRCEVTEEEDVILADLFGDLDISAVDSTEEEASVEAELHVARAGCLSSGS